jgi:hypothetical protein
MATPTAAEKKRKQLERLVEGKRSVSGPGLHVYRFLAEHFAATDVQFVDLSIDWERTTVHSRSGRIFLVTATAVGFIDYDGAPDEPGLQAAQDPGRTTVTLYAKAGAGVKSLQWSDRNLTGPTAAGAVGPWLDAKSITVHGTGWSVDLPSERTADGDGYFDRLRSALEL